MQVIKRQTKTLAVCLIAATLAACAAANNEPKLAALPGSSVSNAIEPATQPAAQAAPETAPAAAIAVRAAEVKLRVGKSAEALIEVVIANGYHANANPASFAYLHPTELTIEKSDELIVGKPIYPTAELKKFGFADEPIRVYEKSAAIKLLICAATNVQPGQRILRGFVRSQPCSDSACFPPRSIEFALPVQIEL